jgi:hypothetical protein
MKQLKYIVLFLMLVVNISSAVCQNNRDKVELLRVSFITKKVELTAAEAEKFWPVYNEYNDKIKSIRRNLKQNYKQKSGNLTDKDAEELYALEQQSRQAELDVHKQYSERLKAIIGVKKMVKLRIAEEEFKRVLIEEIKDRGGD